MAVDQRAERHVRLSYASQAVVDLSGPGGSSSRGQRGPAGVHEIVPSGEIRTPPVPALIVVCHTGRHPWSRIRIVPVHVSGPRPWRVSPETLAGSSYAA